jgi:hypothetical protein
MARTGSESRTPKRRPGVLPPRSTGSAVRDLAPDRGGRSGDPGMSPTRDLMLGRSTAAERAEQNPYGQIHVLFVDETRATRERRPLSHSSDGPDVSGGAVGSRTDRRARVRCANVARSGIPDAGNIGRSETFPVTKTMIGNLQLKVIGAAGWTAAGRAFGWMARARVLVNQRSPSSVLASPAAPDDRPLCCLD